MALLHTVYSGSHNATLPHHPAASPSPLRPPRDFVQSLAQDGYVVVTWANHHYTDFAMSWVYHVQQCGIKGYIVGAMDEAILVALAKKKIHTFSMSSGGCLVVGGVTGGLGRGRKLWCGVVQ